MRTNMCCYPQVPSHNFQCSFFGTFKNPHSLPKQRRQRRSFLFFVLLAKCKRLSICVSKLTKICEASKAETISIDCVREVDRQRDLSFLFLGSP